MRATCRFRQAKCNVCQRGGHISKVCRSKKTDSVKAYKVETEQTDPDFSVFTVDTDTHVYQPVLINGQTMQFIDDSGVRLPFCP